MEKLITVRDVKERYGCSLPTARKYIRQCNPHMENPLAVPEWAFREWEEKRLVYTAKPDKKAARWLKSIDRVTVPRTW